MRRFGSLAAFALGLALVGCASGPTSKAICTDPVCPPVEISGFFRLSASPDLQAVKPGTSRIVVWKFASDFYYFDSRRDGIELLNPKPEDIDGINPSKCHVSSDDQGAVEVSKGPFYRCPVRGHAQMFSVNYNMRFRDRLGIARKLDPLVTNNADPSDFGAAPAPAPAPVLRIRVAASGRTVPVTLDPNAAQATAVDVPDPSPQEASVVIWSAPAGYVFNTDPMAGQADGVVFPSGSGIINPGCRATSDPDGKTDVDIGAYYRCTIWSGQGAVTTTYDIRYRPASGPVKAQTGTFRRAS